MQKWLVVGLLVLAGGVAIVLSRAGRSEQPARDEVASARVEDFRATERACIATFNEALRRQLANEIDELELARSIERDVLVPWRAMRTRVIAAAPTGDLDATLRRYVESRQIAWEAYVAALGANDEQSARHHYDVYHQKQAEAQADAKLLGRMFRERL